jgi:hypothetical protein
MESGKYQRTPEVLAKNKESARLMHQRLGKEHMERVLAKRVVTMREKGIKTGRKKTLVPVTKHCPQCDKDWVATTSYAIRKAKYCCEDCYNASKAGIRPRISMEVLKAPRPYRPRYHLRKPDRSAYKVYLNLVAKHTERVYASNIDLINPYRHPRTLCGVEGGWQLDHIHPLRKCFDDGWTPEQASDVSNLQMLPWLTNLRKSNKSGDL